MRIKKERQSTKLPLVKRGDEESLTAGRVLLKRKRLPFPRKRP